MEHDEDIFQGLGVEIELESEDDFLKVRETLTRMGVSSRKEKKLYQSCHITTRYYTKKGPRDVPTTRGSRLPPVRTAHRVRAEARV